MKKIDYFGVLAIQSDVRYCASREEILPKNLQRHLELIDFFVPASTAGIGAKIRLVVFPEFAIHDKAQSYTAGHVGECRVAGVGGGFACHACGVCPEV